MNITKLTFAALTAGLFAAPAYSASITPDIIFGSGNVNRGFTVATSGDLELGLRAKRRYTSPNDQIGVGIVQDGAGNYLFDSTGQTVPAGRSLWSFDWSINSDVADGSDTLDTYTYQIAVDYDGSAAENMQTYDPLGAFENSYVGTNLTGNGGAGSEAPGIVHSVLGNFSTNNVAQNSVNLGFLAGSPELGAGQFRVSLTAFLSGTEVASTDINVFVDTTPPAIPLPAGGVLLVTALGGLALKRRRKTA